MESNLNNNKEGLILFGQELSSHNKDSNKPRKKRQLITVEISKGVRNALKRNASVKDISQFFDISAASVYKLIKKIGEGLTDEEIALTKKGRKESSNDIKGSDRIYKSQGSISRSLKKVNNKNKGLMNSAAEPNIQTVANTQEYHPVNTSNLVFLDQSAINQIQSRNYIYFTADGKFQ